MKIKKAVIYILLSACLIMPVNISADYEEYLPDLVISDVYISNPCFTAGDVFDIYVTVENIGKSAANKYDLYLLDMKNCNSRIYPNENLCGIWSHIQTIGAGEKQTYRMADVEAYSDTISFSAYADLSDWCIETDNTNNRTDYTFTSLKNNYDINLKNIFLNPSEYSKGDTVTLVASIKNDGNIDFQDNAFTFKTDIDSDLYEISKSVTLEAGVTKDIELTSFVFDDIEKSISVTINENDAHSHNNSITKKFSPISNTIPYNWRNVTCCPGGLVAGSVADYTTGNIYFYTDVGGFYKYNRDTDSFEQMLTGSDSAFPHQCEGIAAKGDIIFAALNYGANTGGLTYIGDSVLARTLDGGKTWDNLEAPVIYCGGGDIKGTKSIIQIDPNNSNILFTGSSRDGAYYTKNALAKYPDWHKIILPDFEPYDYDENMRYIKSIAFDPSVMIEGKSKNIYIAVYAKGIYMSTDAGNTFSLMPDSPKNVISMRCSTEGKLYVISNGTDYDGAYMYENSLWTDITPLKDDGTSFENFWSIDVSDLNPANVAIGIYGKDGNGTARYSTDGGITWQSPYKDMETEYVSHMRVSRTYTLRSVAWDPISENGLWTSNDYEVWYADNVANSSRLWQEKPRGMEELVMFNAVAPSGSDKIYYCAWDSALIMKEKERLDNYPAIVTNSGLGQKYTLAVDSCRSNPDFVVNVGGKDKYMTGAGVSGYSEDGGYTYTKFPTIPLKTDGATDEYFSQVAVSASLNSNGVPTVICEPLNAPLYRTDDLGKTWTAVNTNINGQASFNGDIDLICDTEGRFYHFDIKTGDLYMSEDDGVTFNKISTVIPCTQRVLRAFETNKGYMALVADNTLFISQNGGRNFEKIPTAEKVKYIGVGKKSQYSEYDTLYLIGTVNNCKGIYRSVNLGETWENILSSDYMGGNTPCSIDGDKEKFGTVYVGTEGRGVLVGETELGDVDDIGLRVDCNSFVTTDKSDFTFNAVCGRAGNVELTVNDISREIIKCTSGGIFEVTAGLKYGENTIKLSYGNPESDEYLKCDFVVEYIRADYSTVRTNAYKGTPNVDGIINDGEWKIESVMKNSLLGYGNSTASFGIKYDSEFIYITADVYDETVLSKQNEDEIFLNLYIDPQANRFSRYDEQDRHIKVDRTGNVYDMTYQTAVNSAEAKWTNDLYGFVIELKIPLSYLDISSNNKYFAIELSFNDRDSNGVGKSGLLSWGNTYDPWRRTTNFGICFFE